MPGASWRRHDSRTYKIICACIKFNGSPDWNPASSGLRAFACDGFRPRSPGCLDFSGGWNKSEAWYKTRPYNMACGCRRKARNAWTTEFRLLGDFWHPPLNCPWWPTSETELQISHSPLAQQWALLISERLSLLTVWAVLNRERAVSESRSHAVLPDLYNILKY